MAATPSRQSEMDVRMTAARLADERDRAWRRIEELRAELTPLEARYRDLAQRAYEADREARFGRVE